MPNSVAGGKGGKGGNGNTGSSSGGGGGGAGGYGLVSTIPGAVANLSLAATGGRGGDGGSAAYEGRGGAGGSGGIGVAFNGGSEFVNVDPGALITGGNGGTGGDIVAGGGGGIGGAGGAGGTGLTGNALTLENNGEIRGGSGGKGGTALVPNSNNGPGGQGGAGIVGSGLSIINSGIIAGGMNSAGTIQANAIQMSGSNNRLELRHGSQIDGNVVVSGGSNNTLALGGADSDSFDLSQIGAAAQYRGFDTFEKTGASTWTLTGTGAQNWTIDQGTLHGDTTSMAGNLTFATGAGTRSVEFDQASDGTYSGTISGDGELIKKGNSTLTLTGANTYTGMTQLFAGSSLRAGATNAFSAQSHHELALSSSLNLNDLGQEIGGLSGYGNVYLGSATLTTGGRNGSPTFDGSIQGTGGLSKIGTGSFTLRGTNTYSGLTQVLSGALEAGSTNTFAAQSTHEVHGGATLGLNDHGQTIGALTGGGVVKLGTATLTTGGNDGTTIFSGTIEGAGRW